MKQIENRSSRMEDKVEELGQIVKDYERMLLKIGMEHARYLGCHEKTKPKNHR
jgi:hypothetical protein